MILIPEKGICLQFLIRFFIMILNLVWLRRVNLILIGQIKSELVDDKNKVTKEIMWIAEGPNKDVPTFSGYKINGVTYSTKERDDKRQVQGSGVCVVADTMIVQSKGIDIQHTSHTYYGVITSIWELDYNEFRVPIFRCNWVDMNLSLIHI